MKVSLKVLGLQCRVRVELILGSRAATRLDEFYYEAEYKVLICRMHKRAVRGLVTHLRDAHGLKKKERQPFLDRYAGLTLAKPEDVATPPTNKPPFEALGDLEQAY